jgi:hypothetical protein
MSSPIASTHGPRATHLGSAPSPRAAPGCHSFELSPIGDLSRSAPSLPHSLTCARFFPPQPPPPLARPREGLVAPWAGRFGMLGSRGGGFLPAEVVASLGGATLGGAALSGEAVGKKRKRKKTKKKGETRFGWACEAGGVHELRWGLASGV